MALSPFDEVIQGIAQDPNLARIKKLLVYTCYNTWESDPLQLGAYHLTDLVRTLLAIAPTPAQLKFRLDSVVKTINKSAEYQIVANSLIQYTASLYIPPAPSISAPQDGYTYTTQLLEQDSDQLRIKKLLVCACRRTWENEPAALARFRMSDLVQELYQHAPTADSLQRLLYSIVRTLNRQELYQILTDRILQAFQPLYTAIAEPETGIVTHPTPSESTQFYESPAGQECSPPSPHPAPALTVEEAPVQPAQPQRDLKDLSDLFALRMEIMRYTNPLRAKVVLFSLLHGLPHENDRVWWVVKNQELDDLLHKMFLTYRVFPFLENDLKRIAASLPDASHYSQVVGALTRLLQPFYSGVVKGLGMTPEDVQDPTKSGSTTGGRKSDRLPSKPLDQSESHTDPENTGQLLTEGLNSPPPPPRVSAQGQTLVRPDFTPPNASAGRLPIHLPLPTQSLGPQL